MSHQHENIDVLRTGARLQCCSPATHLNLRLVPSSPPLLQKVDLAFSKALNIWKSRTSAERGGDTRDRVLPGQILISSNSAQNCTAPMSGGMGARGKRKDLDDKLSR